MNNPDNQGMNLTSPSVIRTLLDRHGFRFSKSLGQNFLVDRHIVDRIVAGAGLRPTDFVVEIGPGFGVLTAEICRRTARVLAIEIDRRIPPVLRETVPAANLEILLGDVMKVPLQTEIESRRGEGAVKVVANLPYYITTPILMKLLEETPAVDEIVVMMQREVADRISADPGSRDYGALSLAVRFYAEVETICRVSRGSFMPSPAVDSAVLRLVRRPPRSDIDSERLFTVIRAAFGQRRKTLVNALSGSTLNLDKAAVRDVIMKSGFDPTIRGEMLTIDDFICIADEIGRRDEKAEL